MAKLEKVELDYDVIHKIIDEAIEKRDRYITLFFEPFRVNINIYPLEEEKEE